MFQDDDEGRGIIYTEIEKLPPAKPPRTPAKSDGDETVYAAIAKA